jgi:hypothetical protein
MFVPLEQAIEGFASGDKVAGKFTTVQSMVMVVANTAIIIAMGVTIVTLAYAFIQFITSSGDEKLLDKAQKSVMWSVIGFVVAFIAFALKNILMRTIGVQGI